MTENLNLKQIVMVGFDYKQSPVEIREKVTFTVRNIENAYNKLKQDNRVKECVIISTCNRSEIYVILKNSNDGINYIKNFYFDFFKINEKTLKEYLIIRTGKHVVKHLFEVACGFKSLVLGEDQILGQVKDSYQSAIKYNSSGKFLNRLFLNSITTSKKIKTLTGISENSLSISSIGIKLIEHKLGNLHEKKALIIGLGEMSKICVRNLFDKGIKKVYVTNRTTKKVTDFAEEFPEIIEIDFKNRYDVINNVDIIVSCTAAPHFILHKEKFDKVYENQPLCMLDLAMPRDIEPTIEETHKNINLYRIDDLEEIAKENNEKRIKAKEQSTFKLKQDVKKYINWLEETKAHELISSVQKYSQKIIDKELSALREKLVDIPESQLIAIEKSYRSLAKSILHKQTMNIKELMNSSETNLFEERIT